MKDEDLAFLYRRTLVRSQAERGDDCPLPERLQAVAEGDADADERLAVMAHVAGCLPCQRDLGLLSQVAATRPRTRRKYPVQWLAAAATVLLAFVGIRALGPDVPAPPILRGDPPALTTVSPVGTVTEAAAGSLVWRAMPGATRFEVELLTPGGVLVYSGTVRDTVLPIPPGIAPSAPYRWRVTAVRADGTRTASAWVSFTIEPE